MHKAQVGHDLYFMLHLLHNFMSSFLFKLCLAGTIMVRVMKLGSCLYLEEKS